MVIGSCVSELYCLGRILMIIHIQTGAVVQHASMETVEQNRVE